MLEEILQLREENKALRAEVAGLRHLVTLLMEKLDAVTNENATLKEENQRLKDEIAILKKQKPRPKIPPNTLEGPGSQDKEKKDSGRGKHPRNSKTVRLVIHRTITIGPELLPEGNF